jgi:hypothetical protein
MVAMMSNTITPFGLALPFSCNMILCDDNLCWSGLFYFIFNFAISKIWRFFFQNIRKTSQIRTRKTHSSKKQIWSQFFCVQNFLKNKINCQTKIIADASCERSIIIDMQLQVYKSSHWNSYCNDTCDALYIKDHHFYNYISIMWLLCHSHAIISSSLL